MKKLILVAIAVVVFATGCKENPTGNNEVKVLPQLMLRLKYENPYSWLPSNIKKEDLMDETNPISKFITILYGKDTIMYYRSADKTYQNDIYLDVYARYGACINYHPSKNNFNRGENKKSAPYYFIPDSSNIYIHFGGKIVDTLQIFSKPHSKEPAYLDDLLYIRYNGKIINTQTDSNKRDLIFIIKK